MKIDNLTSELFFQLTEFLTEDDVVELVFLNKKSFDKIGNDVRIKNRILFKETHLLEETKKLYREFLFQSHLNTGNLMLTRHFPSLKNNISTFVSQPSPLFIYSKFINPKNRILKEKVIETKEMEEKLESTPLFQKSHLSTEVKKSVETPRASRYLCPVYLYNEFIKIHLF